MSQELIVQSMREALTRLTRVPPRTTEQYQETEENLRSSIRKLSRSRVSHLLRQLRAAHGLSYQQVQERTGLSQQALFDVEFKDRRLTLEELHRLATCYRVSVGDLLGIDID